jgi:hypothetical protein
VIKQMGAERPELCRHWGGGGGPENDRDLIECVEVVYRHWGKGREDDKYFAPGGGGLYTEKDYKDFLKEDGRH